jgi:TonB family protein
MRFAVYAAMATLFHVGHVVATDGVSAQLYSGSGFRWPKSPQYDIPPKLISGHAPAYPMSQWRASKSGYAIVAFTIGRDGRTSDVYVLQASYPYFGSHTVIAVRDWKFEPAQKNGQPVVVQVRLFLPFKII